MLHVPRSNKKGQMKKERTDSVDSEQHVESMRRTVESTIKKAIACRKMTGQPFPMFTVDSEGNVTTAIQAAAVSMQEHSTVVDQGEGFADDELVSQPLTRAKGKRISRPTRGRGRSTVRRDTTTKSSYPYPQPQQQPAAVLTSDSDEEPPIPKLKQQKSFQIQDTQAVKDFLHSRLKGMQQLADKKIAKAWIKSICPKKQANFPYQNKKAGHGGKVSQPPKVPGWWPQQRVCRFIEPDHIKRTERMDLCLHLLRLRPTPKELKAWNEDKTEPHATHMYEGWTAFLKESAGEEIFDDLPKEDKVRTEHRKNLMYQMYKVADMEEQFMMGGMDGDAEYSWEEDQEERRPALIKRAWSPSTESCADRESRQSSASVSYTRAKRVRQVSPPETSTVVPSHTHTQAHEAPVSKPQPAERGLIEEQSDEGFYDFSQADNGYESSPTENFCPSEAESQPRRSNPFIGQFEIVNFKRETSLDLHHSYQPQLQQPQQHWLKYEHDPMQWTAPPPASQPADSFMSGQGVSMQGPDLFNSQAAPSNFPDRQDFVFPQYPAPSMILVNQVNQVPEPQFHAVSNASMFSPQSMAPMPLNSYMPAQQYDGHMPQEQAYTTTLPPSQFFMPAADPVVTDYHPPMAASQQVYQEPQIHPQYHHHQQPQQSHGQGHGHGLAQRHIVPMHYHGLPYSQSKGWAHPQ